MKKVMGLNTSPVAMVKICLESFYSCVAYYEQALDINSSLVSKFNHFTADSKGEFYYNTIPLRKVHGGLLSFYHLNALESVSKSTYVS